MKIHMHNPKPSDHTRCGQDTRHTMIIALKYGSSDVTCKSCLRFHKGDLAEEIGVSA